MGLDLCPDGKNLDPFVKAGTLEAYWLGDPLSGPRLLFAVTRISGSGIFRRAVEDVF